MHTKINENFIKIPKILELEREFKKNTPKIKNLILYRQHSYRIVGNKVDIGQGCIFVGAPSQILESYSFDTCAPFIMLTKKGKKSVLGHIDSCSTPQEIVDTLKTHFAPKEIESGSFYYFRGADMLAPGENLGLLAINVIEEALKILGVKGTKLGRLTPFDKVIVDSDGLKIERFKKIADELTVPRPI